MSKTSQRRVSAYMQGREDALTGYGFRWRRYSYMREYRAGYNSITDRDERRYRKIVHLQALAWMVASCLLSAFVLFAAFVGSHP